MKRAIIIFILKNILTLHTIAYRAASIAAKKVEPKGEHPKHRLMRYHEFFVDKVGQGDRVLDIGCGKGELAFDVAKKALSVTGIDTNESSIEKAKRKYAAPNITHVIGDATKDLGDKRFDVVILSNVLEHIEKREEFLRSIGSLGKKFLIRVPMINRDWITLYKKELGLEWRLDNTHYTEYTLEQLKEELYSSAFEMVDYSVQFGEIWAVARPQKESSNT